LRSGRRRRSSRPRRAGYEGVLISDFYPGYDAIPCRQQKCWVHLIRDINNDLWKNPFDREFEAFVVEIRNLIVPIIQAVHKYGLKTRHLAKFERGVDRFYRRNIADRQYQSEPSTKFHKRFERYRDSLFLFLKADGTPWENNMAERAIRQLAVQRKISGFFYEDGALQYLRLLGLAQTCRFQEKSFLRFLLSGGKDVDEFRMKGRRGFVWPQH
jgi:Transposase IS66 family